MTRRRAVLTDTLLRQVKPPEKGQVDLWDRQTPGFHARVFKTGRISFMLFYRHDGKYRRIAIGRYPVKSLAEARRDAFGALKEVSEGRDPASKSEEAGKVTPTFATALESYLVNHCRRVNRASTAAEAERILKSTFLPGWGKREVTAISRADVLDVIDGIMARGAPSAARHSFAAIRRFFNWATERGLVPASPCAGLKPPVPAAERDRVLSDTELVTIWNAAGEQGYPFGTIVQLLALTGQRRGEVAGMAWDEVMLDGEAPTWTIPAERAKNGKQHVLPLSAEVVAILNGIQRTESRYVFPARGKPEQPFTGHSKAKRALDAAAGLHDWTLHDLRRTCATGLAALDVAPHIIERILNHTGGTFAGVAGIYNRHRYADEMRTALGRWAGRMAQLTRT